LALVPIALCLREPRRRRTHGARQVGLALRLFWKNRLLRTMGAWSMTGYALGEAGFQFRPVFVASLWPVWAIGIWSTLAHAGGFLGFRLSGRFVRPGRELRIIGVGKLWDAICNFPAFLAPTAASPALLSLTSLL